MIRLDQLTFTRFIAAISIVILHYGEATFPFSHPDAWAIFQQGFLGVSYFFVLSGFIMIVAYSNYSHVNPAEYYKNRFARLYPMLALSVIPYFYFLAVHQFSSLTDILLNLSTLQSWIPGKAMAANYPLWSLTAEVFFFMCFPFLFNYFYKRHTITKAAIFTFLLWSISVFLENYLRKNGFYQLYPSIRHDIVYYFPLMHFSQFLVGNLAGLAFVKAVKTKGNYDLVILLIATLLFVILKYSSGIYYHNGLLDIVFAPLIYFIARNKGIITSIFSRRPLIFLGEISFGIYVLQAPVYKFAEIINSNNFISNPSVFFYSYVVSLLAISALCYYFIEIPLRNRIKTIKLKPFWQGNK